MCCMCYSISICIYHAIIAGHRTANPYRHRSIKHASNAHSPVQAAKPQSEWRVASADPSPVTPPAPWCRSPADWPRGSGPRTSWPAAPSARSRRASAAPPPRRRSRRRSAPSWGRCACPACLSGQAGGSEWYKQTSQGGKQYKHNQPRMFKMCASSVHQSSLQSRQRMFKMCVSSVHQSSLLLFVSSRG